MLDLNILQTGFSAIVSSADGLSSKAMDFALVYDLYARDGTIAGADCSGGGPIALLVDAFDCAGRNGDVQKMALNICQYWQLVPQPGTPSHGGTTVVSVVPVYATLVSAVQAAIESCITTTVKDEPYKKLFKAIEDVLKTAPVIVTELLPGSPPVPTPFPELLS